MGTSTQKYITGIPGEIITTFPDGSRMKFANSQAAQDYFENKWGKDKYHWVIVDPEPSVYEGELPELTFNVSKDEQERSRRAAQIIKDSKETTADRFYNISDFDSLFGKTRKGLVSRHYGKDNPFRQGNDMVARAIGDAYLASLFPGMGRTFYKLVAKEAGSGSLAGAGRLIATMAGGVAGAGIGGDAFDTYVSVPLTGRTWAQNVNEIGGGPLMQIFNPGSLVGSYVGSGATSAVLNGAKIIGPSISAFIKNQPYRSPITGKVYYPGETYTEIPPSTEVPIGQRTVWQGHRTAKPSGARGSAAGQKGYPSGRSGVTQRVMKDVNSGGRVGNTFRQRYYPYPVMEPPTPFIFPGGRTESPTTTTTTPPPYPPITYQPTPGYEGVANADEAFGRWFQQQTPGTQQYYQGDQFHAPGLYEISFKPGVTPRYIRAVAPEVDSMINSDSTSVIQPRETGIFRLPYIVPQGTPGDQTLLEFVGK